MDNDTLGLMGEETKPYLEKEQAILQWSDPGPEWRVNYNNCSDTIYARGPIDSDRDLVLGRIKYRHSPESTASRLEYRELNFCRLTVPRLFDLLKTVLGQGIIPPLVRLVVEYYGDITRIQGMSEYCAAYKDGIIDHDIKHVGFIWQAASKGVVTFRHCMDHRTVTGELDTTTLYDNPTPSSFRLVPSPNIRMELDEYY